jgi:hypothetical protein
VFESGSEEGEERKAVGVMSGEMRRRFFLSLSLNLLK